MTISLSSVRKHLALLGVSLTLTAGCMTFESQEERQVRTDRQRMQRGEPLKYHKDTIELSEHAMEMRVGRSGTAPAASSAPKNGTGYEFRPSAEAAAYFDQQKQANPSTSGRTAISSDSGTGDFE